MNFIEAIATNKPIRRKGKPSHCGSNGTGFVDWRLLIGCCENAVNSGWGCSWPHLSREDILSTDWEVMPDENKK